MKGVQGLYVLKILIAVWGIFRLFGYLNTQGEVCGPMRCGCPVISEGSNSRPCQTLPEPGKCLLPVSYPGHPLAQRPHILVPQGLNTRPLISGFWDPKTSFWGYSGCRGYILLRLSSHSTLLCDNQRLQHPQRVHIHSYVRVRSQNE